MPFRRVESFGPYAMPEDHVRIAGILERAEAAKISHPDLLARLGRLPSVRADLFVRGNADFGMSDESWNENSYEFMAELDLRDYGIMLWTVVEPRLEVHGRPYGGGVRIDYYARDANADLSTIEEFEFNAPEELVRSRVNLREIDRLPRPLRRLHLNHIELVLKAIFEPPVQQS